MPKKTPAITADAFVPVPETTLPGGLVVPAFLVGAYTCSQGSNDKLTINPTGKPWNRISYHHAREVCKTAGYALLTESQHIALAYQIAAQPENWTGGEVGKGKLYQGLRKYNVKEAQPGNYTPADPDERRYFVLPGGHRIYDVAGNIWQWVFDDVQGDERGITKQAFAADSPSLVIPYPGEDKGQGRGPRHGSDWSGFALVRGGYWSSGGVAGVFRLNYGWPDLEYGSIGFRCTKPGL